MYNTNVPKTSQKTQTMTPTTKNNSTSPTTRRSKRLRNMALEVVAVSNKDTASPPSRARTTSAVPAETENAKKTENAKIA